MRVSFNTPCGWGAVLIDFKLFCGIKFLLLLKVWSICKLQLMSMYVCDKAWFRVYVIYLSFVSIASDVIPPICLI